MFIDLHTDLTKNNLKSFPLLIITWKPFSVKLLIHLWQFVNNLIVANEEKKNKINIRKHVWMNEWNTFSFFGYEFFFNQKSLSMA